MASITRRLYVGRLFHPDHVLWPEGAVFVAGEADYNLALFLDDPAPIHVRAVAGGPIDLALHVGARGAALLYRFENAIEWSDAPLAGAVTGATTATADVENRSLPLRIALVDAASGVVRALRSVRLPPYFVQALLEARLATAGRSPLAGAEANGDGDAPSDDAGADNDASLDLLAAAARVTLRVDGEP